MSTASKDKVTRLLDAGLLAAPVHPDVEAKVAILSDAEIQELISVHHKLGLAGPMNKGPVMCGF